jgi:hypothetical protein
MGRLTSCMELFKTLNILSLQRTYTMQVVYYTKFKVGKPEQNLVRQDYNLYELSDLQTNFLIFNI